MMNRLCGAGLACVMFLLGCVIASPASAAADRDKLLSEPGVYGTFAAFRIETDWGKLDQATRIANLTSFKGVVEQHREKLAIDTYLMRGLSDHADFMLRVHGTDLKDAQQFLVDLQNSAFGRYLTSVVLLNGLTKKPNYVPGFSEQLKSDLKGSSESGPYVMVLPIRKDTEWWSFPQEKRAAMMQEHTEAALPYQKTIKRKLYHSTGLDDFDFITYFETAKPEEFHSLILALNKVKEAKHNRRMGNPTLVGTVRSLDQLIEVLAQ
ncbi:MAG: chlorite dismutase family protein [Nitrospira sp.]|nr:chlorite dismutase family protein [Nitrospira sp.]